MAFSSPGTVDTSNVPLASGQGLLDEGAKLLQDWWWVPVILAVVVLLILLAVHRK